MSYVDLNDREFAAVMCGLRLLQKSLEAGTLEEENMILDSAGLCEPMNVDEVGDLAVRLNLGTYEEEYTVLAAINVHPGDMDPPEEPDKTKWMAAAAKHAWANLQELWEMEGVILYVGRGLQPSTWRNFSVNAADTVEVDEHGSPLQ